MSNRPRKRKVITPHQQKIKSRFLMAVEYAKKQIADPVLKAKYEPTPESEFTSAYIAAVADYLRRMKLNGDWNDYKAVERLPCGQHDDSLNRSHLREMQITAENTELIPAEFRSAETSRTLSDFLSVHFLASAVVNLVQTHTPSGRISARCSTNDPLDPAVNVEIDRIDAKTDVSHHTKNIKVVEQIKRTADSIPRDTIVGTITQHLIVATFACSLTMSRAGPCGTSFRTI